jgi:ribonucleoside-diphosphate reductase alpha chain
MYWLNKQSRTFLERDYLLPGVTAEQRIKEICDRAEKILGIKGFSDKFHSYVEKGWYSFSSPVWSNFGLDRGLPISCFGIDIQDDIMDILRASSEIGAMTRYGGGTAGFFGKIRPRGSEIKNNGKTSGAVHFMELFQTITQVVSQGRMRRGFFAAYMPIDHGDIEEFLNCHTEGHPIQDLAFAVTIPEGWMQSMIDGDKNKRKLWAKVLQRRAEKGYPYIFFDDNVNNNLPQAYEDKGLKINHSQMCSEIIEYTDEEKSFVCCLSSLNLLHYDDWKDTDAVEMLTYFLDAVYTEFIDKTEGIPFMEKARKFAIEHRSIGVGVLGWHSYLQSIMIPFESMEAKLLNTQIFKLIDERTLKASKELAKLYGEPKMLEGYGERFTTRVAPAPTTSSSFILGQVSPSIEPLFSNYFVKDLAKGKFTYKNPYLQKLLKDKGMNSSEVWRSIMSKGGSVQHLDFLTEREKFVFKTFGEITPLEIIQQAAGRQKYIDQSQSLNLVIHPDASLKDVNALYIEAWKLGLKTLYYQRSSNLAQETSRNIMDCASCQA